MGADLGNSRVWIGRLNGGIFESVFILLDRLLFDPGDPLWSHGQLGAIAGNVFKLFSLPAVLLLLQLLLTLLLFFSTFNSSATLE